MEDKSWEEAERENKHRMKIISIQKEKLEQTLTEFKEKVTQLQQKKEYLRNKAEKGHHKDIKAYDNFIRQYTNFAQVVDQERGKIEKTVRELCEKNLVGDSTLKAVLQSLILGNQTNASDKKSRVGRFSINKL